MDKEKDSIIIFRIEKEKKKHWKQLCKSKNISLSSLIIDSVEKRLLDNERKKVLLFIEKQDNVFVRIENNINQIAKIANSQKHLSDKDLRNFKDMLYKIEKLKKDQNEIFIKIYSLIGK